MEHHVYFVDAAHAGSRLDAFLSAHLRAHSRTRIQGFIESGLVTVDGTAAKPALRLRRGQRIEITVAPSPPTSLVAEDFPLRVVFEDKHLLVIDKPSGLTVHPGAGQESGTLVNALLARVPSVAAVGSALRPGIVHRLDKDTSGLLVVAKTSAAYQALQSQVAGHTMDRTYVALVHGTLAQETGTVDAPIGRHPRHRTRMAVVSRGRSAVTRYQVMKRFARYTLVEVRLRTGRTHQIRVHFAHLGHPVAGDPVYAGRSDELGIGRQALHAFRLGFVHPVSGRHLSFEAPLPSDFTSAVERARAQTPSRKGRRGSPGTSDAGSAGASSQNPKSDTMKRVHETLPMREKARVMDADAIRRALVRMAHEILERNKSAEHLAFVGVRTRGVPLAHRLGSIIAGIEQVSVPVAAVDITRYRDDRPHGEATTAGPAPLPFDVASRVVVLIDDVLYTGRTVRAALDALIDLGRPTGIQLAVLVDRGHRELPIRPDYVGKNLPTSSREHVAVRLTETDGTDEVVIEEPSSGSQSSPDQVPPDQAT